VKKSTQVLVMVEYVKGIFFISVIMAVVEMGPETHRTLACFPTIIVHRS
jgi:hypothetical protein